MNHTINEGFFKNVGADISPAIDYMKNLGELIYTTPYINKLKSLILDFCGEQALKSIDLRPNSYFSYIAKNTEAYSERYCTRIGNYPDIMKDVRDKQYYASSYPWNREANIVISPDLLGDDVSVLPDWMNLWPSGDERKSIIHNVIIYGFKNLKDISNIFEPRSKGNLYIENLIIFDCPRLTKVNINFEKLTTHHSNSNSKKKNSLLFFPSADTSYTWMEMKRMFRFISNDNIFFKHKESTSIASISPAPKPTNPQPDPSATPVKSISNADSDLPILLKNGALVYTVDNIADPVGRITKDGKNIYKIKQANIWLNVKDDEAGNKICYNKRGIPLYQLK